MVQFPLGAGFPKVERQFLQQELHNIWEPIFLGLPHPNVSGCQEQKPNIRFTAMLQREPNMIIVLKGLLLEVVSEIQTLDSVVNAIVIAVANKQSIGLAAQIEAENILRLHQVNYVHIVNHKHVEVRVKLESDME